MKTYSCWKMFKSLKCRWQYLFHFGQIFIMYTWNSCLERLNIWTSAYVSKPGLCTCIKYLKVWCWQLREGEGIWMEKTKGNIELSMYCKNISQNREIVHNSEGGNVGLILVGSDSGWISSCEEYLFSQAVSPNLTDWRSSLFLYKQTYVSAEV